MAFLQSTKYMNMEAERARRGMSVAQVAEAIGVSPYIYRQTVKGRSPLTVDRLNRLAELYNCDPEYLLETNTDDGRYSFTSNYSISRKR